VQPKSAGDLVISLKSDIFMYKQRTRKGTNKKRYKFKSIKFTKLILNLIVNQPQFFFLRIEKIIKNKD